VKKMTTIWLALAVTAIAACSQGAGGSNAVLPGTSATQHRHAGTARMRIRIPHRHRHRGKHSDYISISTKSVGVSINGGAEILANVTPTSPGCIVTGTPAYTQCTISIPAPVGTDRFLVTTYDGLQGAGNQLSANTVSFKVVSGATTPLNIVLGGIARGVEYSYAGSPGLISPTPGAFDIYGHASYAFTIVPIDADFNVIMGPGAPTISVTPPPGKPFVLGTPTATNPNVYTFQSTYVATNPATPAKLTLTVQATPVPGSGAFTITDPLSISLYQPWIYVTNNLSAPPAAVTVFTEDGTAVPGVAANFSHVPSPTGIAYDSANQWIYVTDGSASNIVCVYDTIGDLISGTYPWADVQNPNGIAYAASNDRLYVANGPGQMNPSVTAYDGGGNEVTLPFPIPLPTASVKPYPAGIAYDSNNGEIYVTDSYNYTLNAYALNGAQQTLSPISLSNSPSGVAFDPDNRLIYVVAAGPGPLNRHGRGARRAGTARRPHLLVSTVFAFDETGAPITLPFGAFSGLTSPDAILYDPYDQEFYVGDAYDDTVHVFDSAGNAIGTPFSTGGTGVWGLALVP
jgi:DNA-binding beta-propeller fold protein YncE